MENDVKIHNFQPVGLYLLGVPLPLYSSVQAVAITPIRA